MFNIILVKLRMKIFTIHIRFNCKLNVLLLNQKSAALAHEMVECLLDDFDESKIGTGSESEYEIDYGAIGTPKRRQRVKKRSQSDRDENDLIGPPLEEEKENSKKSKNRRKRPKKKAFKGKNKESVKETSLKS